MTVLKYLSDTYLEESEATITDIIEMDESVAVYCDNTIFYPQGGGQPSDHGGFIIEGFTYKVYYVEVTEKGVAHILESHPILLNYLGRKCIQRIDIERRLINAKSHSAGHLISHLFEDIDSNLSPAKGHHYPDGSYIEVIESERTDNVYSMDLFNHQLDEIVNQSHRTIKSIELDLAEVESLRPLLSQFIPKSTKVRMIAIDGFTPVPCGGTHITSTSELKGLRITRIKRKKDRIKVSYSMSEA